MFSLHQTSPFAGTSLIFNIAYALILLAVAVYVYQYDVGFAAACGLIIVFLVMMSIGNRYAPVSVQPDSRVRDLWPSMIFGSFAILMAAFVVKLNKKP